jgi:hypothetical protein
MLSHLFADTGALRSVYSSDRSMTPGWSEAKGVDHTIGSRRDGHHLDASPNSRPR